MDTTIVSIKEIVDTMAAGSSGARRAYSEEQKRRIVEETLQPGASVSVIARRHDVNANLVFTWRRRYRSALAAPTMLPVEIVQGSAPAARKVVRPTRRRSGAARNGRIEIELAGGHRLQVIGAVDVAALRQVIETLSR